MIIIDLLKNHPSSITRLSEIWYQVLGKIWLPEVSTINVEKKLKEHLKEDSLPLAFVALDEGKPVGLCCLRVSDGIYPEFTPWLGSLIVDPNYQKQGIGKLLIEAIKTKAQELKYDKLYLFAFDLTIPTYYQRHNFKLILQDRFKGHPINVMECKLK